MTPQSKLYTGLVLLLLTAIFILQNITVVTINILFWQVSASRALMIFLILAIGIAIGWFWHGWVDHRKEINSEL